MKEKFNMIEIELLRPRLARLLGESFAIGYYAESGSDENRYYRAMHRLVDPIMTVYANAEFKSAKEFVRKLQSIAVEWNETDEQFFRACEDVLDVIADVEG